MKHPARHADTKSPELMTIAQAAELLNVHPDTLRNWERRGLVRPKRIGTRKDRRYNREQILKLLK